MFCLEIRTIFPMEMSSSGKLDDNSRFLNRLCGTNTGEFKLCHTRASIFFNIPSKDVGTCR